MITNSNESGTATTGSPVFAALQFVKDFSISGERGNFSSLLGIPGAAFSSTDTQNRAYTCLLRTFASVFQISKMNVPCWLREVFLWVLCRAYGTKFIA